MLDKISIFLTPQPTEGLQSQRLNPVSKTSSRLDADSSKVNMTEGRRTESTATTIALKQTPSVQISEAPPQVQFIESAKESTVAHPGWDC